MVNYSHHNFFSNFTGSVRVGDVELTRDLFLNELTDLVVYKTKKLVDALNKADIQASESDTDETLIDRVINNLDKNQKLVRALAFLFADENKLVNTKGVSKDTALMTINGIADGIAQIGKEFGEKSSLKLSVRRDALKQVEAKAKAIKDYKRTIYNKKNTGAGSRKFFVFSVIVIGGIITYVIYKRWKAGKAIAEARSASTASVVTNAVPPATTTPPTTVPSATPIGTPAAQTVPQAKVTPATNVANGA